MKAFLKNILYSIWNCYYEYRFWKFLKTVSVNSKVYVVDIDNTIAHTWPSLKIRAYRNNNKRYRSLSIFIGMRSFILDKLYQKTNVIFITARGFFSHASTHTWLTGNGLSGPQTTLILVPHPEDKLMYIQMLLDRGNQVAYIDDLSYHHEHGTVKFYTNLISKVDAMPLQYFGVTEIEYLHQSL